MSLKLKSKVLAAFNAAGINLSGGVVNSTCSVLLPGDRYVAWYENHGGYQICRKTEKVVESKVVVVPATSPENRTVVSGAQAKAWAGEGVWSDGSPCKHGYAVVDGVEKGRKTPIEAEPVASLVAPAIDATAIIAAAIAAGMPKGDLLALIAALKG